MPGYLYSQIRCGEKLIIFFFFFSSRRRHTRYIGDWSSDVCSSDLRRSRPRRCRSEVACETSRQPRPSAGSARACRSEERRVGKECRSRWSADQEKKKESDSELRR